MHSSRPDPQDPRGQIDWIRLAVWISALLFCMGFWIGVWHVFGIGKIIKIILAEPGT